MIDVRGLEMEIEAMILLYTILPQQAVSKEKRDDKRQLIFCHNANKLSAQSRYKKNVIHSKYS